MYGKDVWVNFKGKMRTVFVCCNPSTPQTTLEKWALKQLNDLEEKYGNDFEWAYEGMIKGYRV